jgi:hypothetical protein
MIPASLLSKLAGLRRTERLVRFVWGAARVLALAGVLLGLCCLTDWLVDRWQDTPGALRVVFAVVQPLVWLLAATLLIVRPCLHQLRDLDLALWVEQSFPQFGHRLITALQLNRDEADTRGMSPELIALTTRDAEDLAAKTSFTSLVDRRRLAWGALTVAPVAALAAVFWFVAPDTLAALLERQLLADRDIPRSVHLEATTREVWPSGDPVELRFRVTGENLDEGVTGTVRVQREGQPAENYPLVFSSHDGDAALFNAQVPPGIEGFHYRARLRDGRTRSAAQVIYEPRPVVVAQEASVLLPAYVGLKPDDSRYAETQSKGDIVALPDCAARILCATQKPIVEAVLELLGPPDAGGPEVVKRRFAMTLHGEQQAETTFDVQKGETAYRIVVTDRHGFPNVPPARRGVLLLPDETPHVALLPERFPGAGEKGLAATTEVDGMPLPVGKSIRIAYTCKSPLGLAKAQLRYRVNEGVWQTLPLNEVKAGPDVGPFLPFQGVFQNSGEKDQIEFHAADSPDLSETPARREGGGRFDFQTKAIAELKPGDQVEFYVEVFDRKPEPDRKPGKSDPPRVKRVVTEEEFLTWVVETLQQESKIRGLEEKQRNLFRQSER